MLFTNTAPFKTNTRLIPVDSPSPVRKSKHNMEVHNSQCLITYDSPICMTVLSDMKVQANMNVQTCISSKYMWRTVISSANAFWNSKPSLTCSLSLRPSTKKSSMNIMSEGTWKSKVYGCPRINKRENIHKNTNIYGNQRPMGLWSRKPVTQWKKSVVWVLGMMHFL